MTHGRLDRLSRVARASLIALLVAIFWGCSSGPTSPSPSPNPQPPPESTPALTITCPAPTSATTPTGQPVAVTFPAPTASGGRAPIQVSCTPASGSLFPAGPTTVRCTASDALGITSTCDFTVTVNLPPRLSRTSFLAFGDSLTAGEVAAAVASGQSYTLVVIPSASYPTQLAQRLRSRYTSQTLQISNAGVPSEWATDGAKRLPGVMASVRPEVLLLLEGGNELSALGIPGIQQAATAIDTMAKEGRNRGARVFLATLPPPRPSGKNAIPLAHVQALNDRIKITAAGENAVLVDLYDALNTNVNLYIGADGLHPTEAGYIRIAETFFAAIQAALEVR